VRYEFAYDGGQPGSGGVGRLLVNGQPAGEVRVGRTMPFAFSGDEGADVGVDNETPVTEEYPEGNNRFTGRIHKVTVETTPAQRLHPQFRYTMRIATRVLLALAVSTLMLGSLVARQA
jgi:arylsulfatase